jgi:hypothetical protein
VGRQGAATKKPRKTDPGSVYRAKWARENTAKRRAKRQLLAKRKRGEDTDDDDLDVVDYFLV